LTELESGCKLNGAIAGWVATLRGLSPRRLRRLWANTDRDRYAGRHTLVVEARYSTGNPGVTGSRE